MPIPGRQGRQGCNMAIQCPQCRAEYDVTLFTFGRMIQCDCGTWIDLTTGHQRTVTDDNQALQHTDLSMIGLRDPDCEDTARYPFYVAERTISEPATGCRPRESDRRPDQPRPP